MKSSGGGRKRGRPVVLSPEERLRRDRERWRRKTATRRKRDADAKWQRGTNSGYFERLWIPHYNELTKVLVVAGLLNEGDADIAARVDAAVDELFKGLPHERRWEMDFGRSRKLSAGKQGTVRVRMTADIIDRLVAWSCEDEFKKSRPDPRRHPAGRIPTRARPSCRMRGGPSSTHPRPGLQKGKA